MGSRGSYTYSAPPTTRTAPNVASPFERSMTPQNSPAPTPGFGNPGYAQPGFAPRSSFMSGLMGGLIGAGIGGLLLGGGFFGHGLGFGGFLGFLLQVFLIVVIGRFLWRLFTRGRPMAFAGGPGLYARGGPPTPMMGGGAPRPASGPQPINISPQDYQEFEQLLKAAQAAWSARDLHALQGMATPEMVSYFSEQLSEHASRGVINTVTDVRLESGDLAQAWREGNREYASVAMRFSMIDVTRDGAGRVVDGSPSEHVMATELWTFVRASGGHWILSAIQQS
jgi:predicted lipid-binding transport protein (Tim44 family)